MAGRVSDELLSICDDTKDQVGDEGGGEWWEMKRRRIYFSCCRAMVFWTLAVFEAMMLFPKV